MTVNFGPIERLRREPAVGTGHDILATNQLANREKPLGDQLRMLHDVARVCHHARANYVAFGQLDAFESMIFMLMAGIGGFNNCLMINKWRGARIQESPR
jgi:hypothetical protein